MQSTLRAAPCFSSLQAMQTPRISLCLPLLLAVLVAVVQQPARASPTPGKLSQVDVDQVLKNKRLFDNYVKCIMDKAVCSSEGAELKERLPKELATNCKDCSEVEKTRAKKVIVHLKTNRKDVWEDFKKKYDPQNKWREGEWIN